MVRERSTQEARAPALLHGQPGAPSRAVPRVIRKPGKCFPRSRVPTTLRHPPARARVPSAPPPPAARPVPEAETDPNPAPLSNTAPGRASGGGVDGGGPWLGPPLLPALGRRRSPPLLTEHRAWGWSWRDRAGETSELLGGGTPEDSASAFLLPTLLPWGADPSRES